MRSARIRTLTLLLLLLALAFASAATAAPDRPPQQYKPRVMALGDSITWGWNPVDFNGTMGGYRTVLASYLRDRVDWIGRLQNGPPNARSHEGWSGYQIRRLLDLELSNAMTQQPDIILLMIGTNDAWHPNAYPGSRATDGSESHRVSERHLRRQAGCKSDPEHDHKHLV